MSSDAVIEGVAGSLGAVASLAVTYPLLTVCLLCLLDKLVTPDVARVHTSRLM
jgi:hypothetical protein